MIYEWRVYEIVPGKKKNLNERFAKHTMGLFEKHGMSVVGFWENSIGGRTNALYYMLAFKNLDHLEYCLEGLRSRPRVATGGERVREDTLVASIRNMVSSPPTTPPCSARRGRHTLQLAQGRAGS